MMSLSFALITGASSGIGEAFARALSARRHNLVLVARNEEKLKNLAAELISRDGIRAEVLPADLSLPGAIGNLISFLDAQQIEIELLVNNAGFGAQGELLAVPLERYHQMLNLNVLALMDLTYLLLRPMLARRRGSLINISSTACFQPVPYTAVYAATKAFVTHFSMALAEEVRGTPLTVVTVAPGGTATNFFQAGQYGRRSMPGGLQPAGEVVADALRQLDQGSGLVVPRLLNKATLFFQRFLPRSVVLRVTARLFRPEKQ